MNTMEELKKKQILVVEDDLALARAICDTLKMHGASVVGPAPTIHYARLIVGKRRLDGAVLDINLFGEEVYGLAAQLMRQGVPLLFATEYHPDEIAENFRHVETLHKPIDFDRLVKCVSEFQRVPMRWMRSEITATRPPSLRKFRGAESVYDKWSSALAQAMRDQP